MRWSVREAAEPPREPDGPAGHAPCWSPAQPRLARPRARRAPGSSRRLCAALCFTLGGTRRVFCVPPCGAGDEVGAVDPRADLALEPVQSPGSHARRFEEIGLAPRATTTDGESRDRTKCWPLIRSRPLRIYCFMEVADTAYSTPQWLSTSYTRVVPRTVHPRPQLGPIGWSARALHVRTGRAEQEDFTRDGIEQGTGKHNKRMNLTARPVTRLAVQAPPRSSSQGDGQGARPSRPAGYARR